MVEESSSTMRKNNYLHEVLEINRRSDIRMKRLRDGEEEKTALKNEVLLLQKKESDLKRKIKSQNDKISKLKLEEYSLAEERKFFKEMEEKNLQNKSSKEDELWKMRQSVYSSVALHCDGILDVMKNYSLKNMKEFIEAKLDKRECFNKDSNPFAKAVVETSMKNGSGRKKILTDEISRLSFCLGKLKEKEAGVLNAQSRRAELKYEPVNGDEYIRLQNELKDLRNDIITITTEISALEKRDEIVAMDEEVRPNIASKDDSNNNEDSLQSAYSSYSRDCFGNSLTLNQYHENVEQDTMKGHKLGQQSLHGKFEHQNVLRKSSTQERNKTQESTAFKEASKSQVFVFKPPKYFKQSLPE